MKRLALGLILLGGVFFLPSSGAQAQVAFAGDEAFLSLLKEDIGKEVTDIITRTMAFTAEEAAAFWPVYKEYDDAQDQIADTRIQLLKEYSAVYTTMTDCRAV